MHEGGLNSGENWLCFCVSLINKGSQFCTKFLPGMHQHILEWVDFLQKHGELNSKGCIKNMEMAWTKVNAKKFGLNWMPIALKIGKVLFIKATIAQRVF